MPQFEAIPLTDPEDFSRAHIIERIVRGICKFETVFSDFQRGCEEGCTQEKPVAEMCEECQRQMATVVAALAAPNSLTWEVWETSGDTPALAGVVYVTNIRPGEDATGHYVFFDGKLADKTETLRAIIAWLFESHDGWTALRRLTVEIPAYSFAVARHAARKLGFGGPFNHRLKGATVPVEGVKREAIRWRGKYEDLLIMGKLKEGSQNVE